MILSASNYLGHIITTEMITWGICIGAIFAFSIYFFQMRLLGSLVRKMLECAVGEENGKTLDELGKNNAFYRHSLRKNGMLRRLVDAVAGAPCDENGDEIIDKMRFYIDAGRVEKATKRYQRDVKLWMYLLGVASCVAVGVVMHFTLPLILALLP